MSDEKGKRRVSLKLNKNNSVLDETLFDCIDLEDDKVQREKVKLKQINDVNDGKIPDNSTKKKVCVSPKKITDCYQTCIKLSAENKINTKNAFNLKLIDYMSDIIKSSKANDTNFQIASLALDASAKIYSCRVDSLYSDTFKLLNILQHKDENLENENPKDQDEDVIKTTTKKPKRKVGTPGCNIEKNVKNITRTKVSQIRHLDPIFRKMSESFDAGCGAKGLFLYNTTVTPGFGLYVDSQVSRLLDIDRAKAALTQDGQPIKKMMGKSAKYTQKILDLAEMYKKIDHRKLKLCSKTESLNFSKTRESEMDMSRMFDEMRITDDEKGPESGTNYHLDKLMDENGLKTMPIKDPQEPECWDEDNDLVDVLEYDCQGNQVVAKLGEEGGEGDMPDEMEFDEKTLVPNSAQELEPNDVERSIFAPVRPMSKEEMDEELRSMVEKMASKHPDYCHNTDSVSILPTLDDLRHLRPKTVKSKVGGTSLRKKRIPHTIVFTDDINYWQPEEIAATPENPLLNPKLSVRTFDSVYKKAPTVASICLSKRALAKMASKPQLYALNDRRADDIPRDLESDLMCLNLLPNLKIKLKGKYGIKLELKDYGIGGRKNDFGTNETLGPVKRAATARPTSQTRSSLNHPILSVERLSYAASFLTERLGCEKESDCHVLDRGYQEEGSEPSYDDAFQDDDGGTATANKDDKGKDTTAALNEQGLEATFHGLELLKPPRKIEKLVLNFTKKACTTDIRLLKSKAWDILEDKFNKHNDPRTNLIPSSPVLFNDMDPPARSITFSALRRELYKDKDMQINNQSGPPFTDPILFITLLFLANEKNLQVTYRENFSDLNIHLEQCESEN